MSAAEIPTFLAAVLGIAWSREGDVRAAIRALPNGAALSEAAVSLLVHWLAEHEYVDAKTQRLTERGVAAIGAMPLGEAAIAADDLSTVTRRFIEEVLAGAQVPDELIETIIQTYVARGTLRMSEDGGRYFIELP